MTPAYIVFIKKKVINTDESGGYRAKADEILEGHHLELCATDVWQEVLEGASAEDTVVLKFPDWDSAKLWYHGRTCQEAAPHGFEGEAYQAILVEGHLAGPAPA